jgi:hypothetical protein
MWSRGGIIALVVCLATLYSLCDVAASPTAGEFLRRCEGLDYEKHATLVGWCLGYVQGVWDGHEFTIIAQQPSPPAKICLPEEGLKLWAVVDRILGWLRQHPESQEQPIGLVVLVALVEMYPCRSGVGKTK